MYDRDVLYVGGRWTASTGNDWIEVISPMTEETFARVPWATAADADAAVAAAREAFDSGPWPQMSVAERASYLRELVARLQPRIEEITHLQIDEMGGPYGFMKPVSAGVLDSVEREIETVMAIDEVAVRDGMAGKLLVRREPVGVSVAIIPWNGPFAMVVGRVVPALLTGCTLVLKPAPETPLSAYLVAEALHEAGLPPGVFNLVPGGREVGEQLVTHPGVDRVSFTGSSAAGSRVAALCGRDLKPATLELGGKSAALVLADADLDAVVGPLITSSMPNNGQVCHATTRILVDRGRRDELVDRLTAAVGAMRVGDPHQPDTHFGPLVAQRQRERVEGYIAGGLQEGAKLALGGGRPSDQPRGWYVEPTVFVDVDNGMRIAQEEIFGPVVCVIEYAGEDEAVAIANASDYGLGGVVYTSDVEHGVAVASRVKTGTCRVNESPTGGGGGPFGGVKRSGLGRERDREGYESYYDLKTITLPAGYVPSGEAGAGEGAPGDEAG